MDKEELVTHKMPPKELMTFTASEIYTGKMSPHGVDFAPGNTVLLREGSKYIYIGSEIYQLELLPGDSIEQYYSDIGNNDVPYPYIQGKTHMYFMLEKVAIERSFFDMKKDIVNQYYEADTYIPMELKGHFVGKPRYTATKADKQKAKERIAELAAKIRKLRTKLLQARNI